MKNRIKLIRKELNLTQAELAVILGVGKSAVSMIETGKASLSQRNRQILEKQLGVNKIWLDTGKGSMFVHMPHPTAVSATDIATHGIPLYDPDQGFEMGRAGEVPGQDTLGYIHIPGLSQCDGAVRISGAGMQPVIRHGDIVIFRLLSDLNDVFWGDTYLLSLNVNGETQLTVKILQESEKPGYIKLISHNPLYADREIAIDKINSVAMIKATVSLASFQ